MFKWLKKNREEKRKKEEEILLTKNALRDYCYDLDTFSNNGVLRHCITKPYKYLEREYDKLFYRFVSDRRNAIIYNKDYAVIYACNNKNDLEIFLNQLYNGKL